MWYRAEQEPYRSMFINLMSQHEDYSYYSEHNFALTENKCEMWLWNDGETQIATSFRISGSPSIYNGTPTPGADAIGVVKIIVRKAREVFDSHGIADWSIVTMREYQSDTMEAIADGIDRLLHEVEGVEDRGTRKFFKCNRKSRNRKLDELFEGPGKGRKKSDRVKRIRGRE